MLIATWILAIATLAVALEGVLALRRWGARWSPRMDRGRSAAVRRENNLHRLRFGDVYRYWHDLPASPEQVDAARWYSEWTGAARPRRGGIDDGPMTPGFGAAGEDDAYQRYLEFLSAQYVPQGSHPRPVLGRDAHS